MSCPNEINEQTGECQCNTDEAVVEKDQQGNYLETKICKKCSSNSLIDKQNIMYECKECPSNKIADNTNQPPTCRCDLSTTTTAGDECLPNEEAQFITVTYPVNLAKSISFSFEETFDSEADGTLSVASSDTIEYLYLKSAYDCLKGISNESCNALANLCVIQMYDKENVICKFYNYLNDLSPAVVGTEE